MQVTFPPVADPALTNFAALARSYCALIDSRSELTPDALLISAHAHLPRLYAAGLDLPGIGVLFPKHAPSTPLDDGAQEAADSARDEGSSEEWDAVLDSLRAQLQGRDNYREVFNPYDPAEELQVVGSLADDLSAIHRDLLIGLRKWDRQESGHALWDWRSGLENHWGKHLTSALRALHSLAANYELDWPPRQP